MSKISILEIIGDSTLAGAPRHFLGVIENINLDKFKVYAICPPGSLAGEIRSLKRHIELDVISMKSRMDLRAISRIRKVMTQIKPDLIHIHGTRAGILARIASVGLGIPVIYTEHLWTKSFHLSNRMLNFIHYSCYSILDLVTTANIAVSEAVSEFLVASGISREEKVNVIYNGIKHGDYEAKVLEDEELKIASIGMLNFNKGMQYLIQAMPKVVREFPEAKLEIIGDGEFKPELMREVKHLKLEKNIKFVGFVADIEKYLQNFDLYVQPSISESFGYAIVQAMSVGLPVVATTGGAIPEVVVDAQTGLLVEPTNSKELSDAILKILRDPEWARSLGQTARKWVRSKFEIKDMVEKMEKVYEKVYKSPPVLE